jgi:hypothetical protein
MPSELSAEVVASMAASCGLHSTDVTGPLQNTVWTRRPCQQEQHWNPSVSLRHAERKHTLHQGTTCWSMRAGEVAHLWCLKSATGCTKARRSQTRSRPSSPPLASVCGVSTFQAMTLTSACSVHVSKYDSSLEQRSFAPRAHARSRRCTGSSGCNAATHMSTRVDRKAGFLAEYTQEHAW